MKKCKVVHHKKDPFDILIDRRSKWGNPFSHKKGTLAKYIVKNRKEAIESYKNWLLNGEGKYLLNDIHELSGKILGCWCKPKSCHGDVLVEIVNNIEIGIDI
jgi:hypothetical protein